ncbi:MAG: TFIIB-type zinc ribbon-containing protein [Acidilobaceae archaeon]
MICRYCGSTDIVWDHASGHLVCASCGSVLETIMEHSPTYSAPKRRFCLRPEEREVPRRAWGLEGVLNKRALGALKNEHVKELLEVVNSHPLLKARTFRVKVALAAYLYHRAMGYSKRTSMLQASKMTGVPPRTMDKLESKYRTILTAAEGRARSLVRS